jgi:hypothetical protein
MAYPFETLPRLILENKRFMVTQCARIKRIKLAKFVPYVSYRIKATVINLIPLLEPSKINPLDQPFISERIIPFATNNYVINKLYIK